MGCASSKLVKKQEESEDCFVPQSKYISQGQLRSLDEYHSHLVALTSTSYGLLKVDPNKPVANALEEGKKASKTSVDEVLERAKGFDLAQDSATAPKSWTEVSSMLETLKSGSSELNLRKGGKPNIQGTETIDLRDIMQDIDEDAPSTSKPKTMATPVNTTTGKLMRPFDKSISFHTIEEVDACLGKTDMQSHQSLQPTKSASLASHRRSWAADLRSAKSMTTMEARKPDKIAFRSSLENPRSPSHHAASSTVSRSEMFSDAKHSSSNGKASFNDSASNQHSSFKGIPLSSPKILTEPTGPLFDPDLLSSYEKALENLSEDDWNAVKSKGEERSKLGRKDEERSKLGRKDEEKTYLGDDERRNGDEPRQVLSVAELVRSINETSKKNLPPVTKLKVVVHNNPLDAFEKRCPPGGENSVVLYTTTLRGIRKTFDDCNNTRALLEGFGIVIDERDVSMHLEFRNELKTVMEKAVSVPRLFIKGSYIGGAEEVAKLNDGGQLAKLLQGLPSGESRGACDGCGGLRFVPCLECSGSCRIVDTDNNVTRCPDCNENGLIQCPICS